jgi:hypothetical protein
MNFSAMREVVDYWLSKYDWRQAESSLNRFPQFLAQVGDFRIHSLTPASVLTAAQSCRRGRHNLLVRGGQ